MFQFLMNLSRSTAYTGVLWIQVGDQPLGSLKMLFHYSTSISFFGPL